MLDWECTGFPFWGDGPFEEGWSSQNPLRMGQVWMIPYHGRPTSLKPQPGIRIPMICNSLDSSHSRKISDDHQSSALLNIPVLGGGTRCYFALQRAPFFSPFTKSDTPAMDTSKTSTHLVLPTEFMCSSRCRFASKHTRQSLKTKCYAQMR